MGVLNSAFYSIFDGTIFKHIFTSYMTPFVIFFIIILITNGSCRHIFSNLKTALSTKLFLIFIVLATIESAYLIGTESFFYVIKNIFYSNVLSSLLTVTLLVLLLEITLDKNNYKKFINFLLVFLSIKAVGIIIYAWILISRMIEYTLYENEFVFCASQSYESMALIIFLLLFNPAWITTRIKTLLLLLHFIPVVYFGTKGAMLAFLIIVTLYILNRLYLGMAREYIKKISILIVMSVIVILNIKYVGPLTSAELYSSYKQFVGDVNTPYMTNNDLRASTTDRQLLGQRFMRILDNIQTSSVREGIDLTSVFNGLGLLKAMFKKEPGRKEFDVYSYRVDISAYNERRVYVSDIKLNDESLSLYTRLAGLLFPVFIFYDNPIFGVGSFEGYNYKIEGYGIHSLNTLLLMSYGLIGCIPIIALFVNVIKSYNRKGGNKFTLFIMILYILLISTFVNSFVWWYALPLFYMAYHGNRNYHVSE